ncbi:undecaprenyl-phosphate glucose phosphotransferase [Affinibrenneria salicis]|uniref:Undecaprenyl-phosphate glucose phosphotransferase n=1 Tax=Affinibrenneria salicis TaxID=2590031 RepID=A0A5J5G097_9GAMM|nr:undecaprenyl-phosphate glucose phosphotransferase [Affinibrenneria salicis]KAA8999855.1 undecaprenyl-phosphate glucose phosphotransferase [Affinibrenneria salicis]
MKTNQGVIIYTNASIISMLQRFSDISIILLSTFLVSTIVSDRISLQNWLFAFISLSIFQMIGGITDFYRSWRGVSFRVEMQLLIRNWLLSVIFSAGILSIFPSLFIGLKYHIIWLCVSLLGFLFARISIRAVVRYLRKLGYNSRRVVVVGDSVAGFHLIDSIMNAPWLGLNVVGYYTLEGKKISKEYDKLNINSLGDINKLIESARSCNIDKVYIALPMHESELINNILTELSDTTCTVLLVPDIFTFNLLQSRSEMVNGIPVISLYDTPMSGINMIIKRIEDVTLSLLIILLISPLLLLISCVVKTTSPGPVIFKQKRYGIDGKAIDVWKFRSMSVMENGDNVIQARKGDSRITPVGAFLRRTSLDELPQFFNVVKGDMSIVGPRPHAVAHNEQYRKLIKGYMLRHKMKPGITGWAQINGWRGETETLEKMEKRIEFDLFYIQNWSVWLDCKIIFLTIFKGFVNKSAY